MATAAQFPIETSPNVAPADAEKVKLQCQAEIAGLIEGGLKDWEQLVVHVFQVDDVDYICWPTQGGFMGIDRCVYEEMDTLTEGPFAGKALCMPFPMGLPKEQMNERRHRNRKADHVSAGAGCDPCCGRASGGNTDVMARTASKACSGI